MAAAICMQMREVQTGNAVIMMEDRCLLKMEQLLN